MLRKTELLVRMQQKHNTEENWLKTSDFIPLSGEIIVYDTDTTHSYQRFKVGDGTTNVVNLPFAVFPSGSDGSASGLDAINLGHNNSTIGKHSIAIGENLKAEQDNQYVIGKYNSSGNYLFAIGDGNETSRSNAFEVFNNGNSNFLGYVTANSYPVNQTPDVRHLMTYTDVINLLPKDSENPTVNITYNGVGRVTAQYGEIFNNVDTNQATGLYSHSEGRQTSAIGEASHAEGRNNHAAGNYSHVEGLHTKAFGPVDHAEGADTLADGGENGCAHAEGSRAFALAFGTHAEGVRTIAYGSRSHAEGGGQKKYKRDANGVVTTEECQTVEDIEELKNYWNCAEATGSHVEGWGTYAYNSYQHVQGKWNSIGTNTDRYVFIIGNGTIRTSDIEEDTIMRNNAFSITWEGNVNAAGSVNSTGADYAEYFEWEDGNPNNEDRIGCAVALRGEKIYLANEDDEILGIVSGTTAIVGDNYPDSWKNKYLTDDYGRTIYEKYTAKLDDEEYSDMVPKLNPEYDESKTYISRGNRPEWDTVGLIGKIYANDDGSCIANGYAKVLNNGILTYSSEKTNIRVMRRVKENIVYVLLK